MLRTYLLAGAALLTLAGPADAQRANRFDYAAHGYWGVAATVMSETGKVFCSIYTSYDDNAAEIHVLPSESYTAMMLFDATWSSSHFGPAELGVRIDNSYAEVADGETNPVTGGMAAVFYPTDPDRFDRIFRQGRRMELTFPDGSSWTATLRGTAAAWSSYMQCVSDYDTVEGALGHSGYNPFQ